MACKMETFFIENDIIIVPQNLAFKANIINKFN
jgi:hypothetical protein